MIVKNRTNGRQLMLAVDNLKTLEFLQARVHMPNLRVEARSLDGKRLFLVALCDLELVHDTSSDLSGLAARSVS